MARRLLTPLSGSDSTIARPRPRTPVLTLAFVVMAAGALPAQQKSTEAWWLNATFTPSQTAYESLPVKDISPDWARISVLSYASLPAEAKSDFGWMRRRGFVFRVDNYFKRKGVVDRELSGVYEDQAGHKGRFLLVLERRAAGPWKVAFLHQEAGEAGFSVFARRASGLYWGTCMQCGEFSRLRRKGGKFQLDEAP